MLRYGKARFGSEQTELGHSSVQPKAAKVFAKGTGYEGETT